MTSPNYNVMDLDELRRYVLTHREDGDAFQIYVDRSKAEGRMISIDPADSLWEEEIARKLRSSQERY
jgi:hypothetical protein